MVLQRHYRLQEIAEIIGSCKYLGDKDHVISGLSLLPQARAGDLSFADTPKYYARARQSQATSILAGQELPLAPGKALIVSNDPFGDFARLITLLQPSAAPDADGEDRSSIHPTSRIHRDATIGAGVRIGRNCVIHGNAVLYNDVVLGDNVVIHSNSVIGSDGFYFQRQQGRLRKMPSGGICVIESDVEIGAACTIDRGVTGATRIGRGSKLDNQVQVGHDTIIGANCLIGGCVGIAGCVTIEDEVVIWGQAGVNSSVTIGKGAEILAQSAVLSSIEGGKRYFGTPARAAREVMRELALVKELAGNARKVRQSLAALEPATLKK